ncbi:hypothetical protein H072_5210 [Dactylellina haptotyla CBS 200.50]|uniref:CRAL-TRIO domain-containing protein n=1 Tax=Dactylellina haptotyla (strain CBS 200.50) TaxID=1284197 RepID=S8AD58_DACHA|nr:hypothetical protein H072_5210 [Dactylellina haptotyla CBS 200.50]
MSTKYFPVAAQCETLIAEQEAKFAQLWSELLKIFGLGGPSKNGNHGNNASELDLKVSDLNSLRKKTRGLFGQSKKDKNSSDNSITEPITNKSSNPEELEAVLASPSAEDLRIVFWEFVKHDDPDVLLLHFLRARKWDVQSALTMLISALQWRQTMEVEKLVRRGEGYAFATGDKDFISHLQSGKAYLYGKDREERPICVVSTRLHQNGEQSLESIEKFTIYILEIGRLLRRDPIDTSCILFDLTGFGLSNMDYGAVKFMIGCLEARYPETLGICLIHNAPWVFQGIWRVIKGWLDPVVASKVQFTSNTTDLEKYIDISYIPVQLGGHGAWRYDYTEPVNGENSAIISPSLDNIREKMRLDAAKWDLIRRYEKNTLQWAAETKGVEWKALRDERKYLRECLKLNYRDLDSFVRARTYYDRCGILSLRDM